ncbi:MAG: hypothetical protein R2778_01610 [Saprospiraceae bacterium]
MPATGFSIYDGERCAVYYCHSQTQLLWHEESVEAEAIDIMLVMDLSPSMLSKDFSPDRLTVAKEMANTIVNPAPTTGLGWLFPVELFSMSL